MFSCNGELKINIFNYKVNIDVQNLDCGYKNTKTSFPTNKLQYIKCEDNNN